MHYEISAKFCIVVQIMLAYINYANNANHLVIIINRYESRKMNVHLHSCLCYVHKSKCIHFYVCMYVCMYIFMYVRIYVCMYAHMYVCTYIFNIYRTTIQTQTQLSIASTMWLHTLRLFINSYSTTTILTIPILYYIS